MKQDIENIIKKNLPEKKEYTPTYPNPVYYQDMLARHYNDGIDDIDISLIADEVLKVTKEELIKWCDMQAKRWCEDGVNNSDFRGGVASGYLWMKDHIKHFDNIENCRCPKLLSEHLSPNKENENYE